MPVVSISRQFGAGGRTLGQKVAARLGYQFVDHDLIDRVAEKAEVSVEWVEAVEREVGGRLMRILSSLVSSNFIERLLGDSASDFDERKYLEFVKKVMHDIAEQGEAVIIGRASQIILADNPEVVRVLLVADMEDRIDFMMKRYNLDRISADRAIAIGEKNRTALLNHFGVSEPNDPSYYHVVINTSETPLKWAEDIVCSMVGCVLDQYTKPIWD